MIKDSSSSTKEDLWSMWSSQVNTTLCRGKEQAWLSEGIGPAAKRMANNTKTYHYCHSYISTKHCIKKTVFWLIWSPIQSMRLPVEERNRHEIGLWGCFTSKGANTTKTYYWCHSSIINKSFSIKTVFWLVVSPFYQWEIEAGLLRVSGMSCNCHHKKQQQDKTHTVVPPLQWWSNGATIFLYIITP